MKYFGTDGIRGKAHETLTKELAYRVGNSLFVFQASNVVIACDTRESSDILVENLAKGAQDAGKHVIIAGVLPTPGLMQYAMQNACIGVMITASHNPYEDNGIKVFDSGKKLQEKQEAMLEAAMDDVLFFAPEKGTMIHSEEPYLTYKDFLIKNGKHSTLRVGLDLANGATYKIAKDVFDTLGIFTKVIAMNPDGKNINAGVGSTHIQAISDHVKQHALDVGFAFDGDGDRVLAVDQNGKLYDGDMIVYIIASYLKQQGLLAKDTVVLSVMSNVGLLKQLKKQGIHVHTTPVGDKYVLDALLTHDYAIGGENSGHIIMPNLTSTGDAIAISLCLLAILSDSNKSLASWVKDVKMYPDRMVNLRVKDKAVAKRFEVQKRVKEIEETLGEDGKVILRASGTEDLVRVSVMAPTVELMNQYVDELVALVKRCDEAVCE